MTNTCSLRGRVPLLASCLLALTMLAVLFVPSSYLSRANAAIAGYVDIGVTADGSGYVLAADGGETYAFGTVAYHDNPSGFSGTIASVATTADGQGYLEVSSTGQAYAYGSVQHWGNAPADNSGIVDVAVTADGQGYVMVSNTGQVYAFGSVQYHDPNPSGFEGGIVGIAVTADGSGYVIASGAGQVYAYGNVQYRDNANGSSGIVDIAVTGDGQGYVMVSNSGQVYALGTVAYHDPNPSGFEGGIVGITTTADGAGYAALSGSGQVYAYGTVSYLGNGDPNVAPQLAQQIAGVAERELADVTRDHEEPAGSNCNFYSGAFDRGANPKCPSGWGSEQWCADFAGWVWQDAGASIADLTAGVVSFKTYADNNGTWKDAGSVPAVGDAVLLDWTDTAGVYNHVGVVVSVDDDSFVYISGNTSRDDPKRVEFTDKDDYAFDNSAIVGFTSPVPA